MNRISKEINDELDRNSEKLADNEYYTTGETSTVNFVMADGQQQMFPYSQLITAWTENTDEENVIKVFFATHVVAIKGLNLSVIYKALTNQNLISVVAQDERYLKASDQKKAFVKKIEIEWKGSLSSFQ